MTELRHQADLPLPVVNDRRIEGHFGLALDKLAAVLEAGELKVDTRATLCRLMDYATVKGPRGQVEHRPRQKLEVGVEEKALLEAQHTRLDALVAAHGCRRTFTTMGPLAIGLGNASPLENGITIHPTYGVPYLPGSAIKGMVGAWAEHWLGLDPTRIAFLFGRDLATGEASGRGAVTFLDALPCPPAFVVVDVMTPHAGPYYRDPPLPPADWHSPNPISFLAVPAGQAFRVRFMVEPRGRLDPFAVATLLDSMDVMLTEAFATIGIGAKTAAGYGRLEPRIDP